MKIISVVGARPNFMKIAPFIEEINQFNIINNDKNIEHILVHTGQHYDDRMSRSFFESLNIPDADINLGIGSGSHAEQVGNTMIEFEKVLIQHKPDWVVVLGDVNATLACSVTAKKLHIKVCHIEAGLRSGDIKMPEEINRLVTDRISDLLLTPDTISIENLKKEGVEDYKINFVGNIMIDTLIKHKDKANSLILEKIIEDNLIDKSQINNYNKLEEFVLVTLHRPSNVDSKEILAELISFLIKEVTQKQNIIWAVHPRTEKQLKQFDLWESLVNNEKIILLHPLGYHEMLKLNILCSLMLTDSGGLQEECTVLGTPCLTMRWNTERPVTLTKNGGISILVGNDVSQISIEYNQLLGNKKKPKNPELWDGRTAKRCLDALINFKNQ